MKKIVNIPDLGSGMPLKGHPGISFAHAAAIINNLDKCLAGVIYDQLNFTCTSIHGILQQFFHGTGRSLNDLTGSNLVGNMIGKQLYSISHGIFP
jgi:hypothetical protein